MINQNIKPPVIVFLDGHVSHKSLQLCEFCFEHQIVLVSFLPNSTHICQPMDFVMFSPMKKMWSQVVNNYKAGNPTVERMSKKEFCFLLRQCLDQCMKPDLFKKSFESTALYPFGYSYFNVSNLTAASQDPNNDDEDRNEIRDELHTEEELSVKFIERLENLINYISPNLVSDFEACKGDWDGCINSKDLFAVWKMAVDETNNFETTSNEINEPTCSDEVNEPTLSDEVNESTLCDEDLIVNEVESYLNETEYQQNNSEDEIEEWFCTEDNTTLKKSNAKGIISSYAYIEHLREQREKKQELQNKKMARKKQRLEKAELQLVKLKDNVNNLRSQIY